MLLWQEPTEQRPVRHVAGGPSRPLPAAWQVRRRWRPWLCPVSHPAPGDGPSPGGGSSRTAVVPGRLDPRGLGLDAGPSLTWAHSVSLSVPQFLRRPVGLLQGPWVAVLVPAGCREGTGRGRAFAWGLWEGDIYAM